MAEIDAAINKLISELKKLQGEAGGGAVEDAAGEKNKGLEEANRIISEINNKYDQKLGQENKSIENAKQELSVRQKELQALLDNIQAGDELTDQTKERIAQLQEAVKQQERFVELTREAAEEAKNLGDSFSNILGGPDAVKVEDVFSPKAIGGAISGLTKIAKTQQMSALASEFATKAGEKFLGSIVRISMQLADNEAKFMKATGANKQFARSVTNSYDEMREFGATSEEVSATYQELFTNFTDFTMLSEKQRESIANTGVALSKLGISNQDFAKSIQISTKAMGMSAAQAGQNMLNLEKFAEDLGVAPQQLAADFAGAGDMLAKLGSQGTRAFKDLAIAAKVTGMSIDSIVNLTNKFDTFDGAADQAGKLNAALGGNFVNAMDLMMATNPAERFEMIRDSILDAGLSFDDMSYYQKNFYRDSLGLSDVGELAALMSGDMDLVSGATQQSAQDMIDAKKRAHEMATMQENLNTVLANMIPIIEPIVAGLKSITEGLAENATAAKALGITLGVIGMAYMGITGILKLASIRTQISTMMSGQRAAALGTEAGAVKAVTEAQEELNEERRSAGGLSRSFIKSIKDLGKALSQGAKGFIAIGIAAVGIGTGIYLAAQGAAELALAFENLGEAAPYAAAGIFAVMLPFGLLMGALIALVAGPQAAVTGAAVGVFLAVGAAALMMGAGMALAAAGFALLVNQIGKLDPSQILDLGAALYVLAPAIGAFGASLMFLANPIVVLGIITMTASIIALHLVLGDLEETVVNVSAALSSMFANMVDPNIGENFKAIGQAISDIPTRKNIEFAATMAATATAAPALKAMGAASEAMDKMFGNKQQAPVSQNTKQEITVNLMLNKDKLGEVVFEILGDGSVKAIKGAQ